MARAKIEFKVQLEIGVSPFTNEEDLQTSFEIGSRCWGGQIWQEMIAVAANEIHNGNCWTCCHIEDLQVVEFVDNQIKPEDCVQCHPDKMSLRPGAINGICKGCAAKYIKDNERI